MRAPAMPCGSDTKVKGQKGPTGFWLQKQLGSRLSPTHQFSDLTLQVQDTVQLPLAAALGCDAILAAPPDVMNKLQLF